MNKLQKVKEVLELLKDVGLITTINGEDFIGYSSKYQQDVQQALVELNEFMLRLESGSLLENIANAIDEHLVYDKASGSRFLNKGQAAQAAINVIRK